MTYKGDPQLTTWPKDSQDAAWLQCVRVAYEAVCGISEHPFPGADSYFDVSINPPAWATPDKLVGQSGRIRFFDIDCDHERAAP